MNTLNRILFTIVILFGCSAQLVTADESSLVKIKQQVKAIQWHSIQDTGNWGYTIESRLDNGKLQQRIQRYSPVRPAGKQWELLEQDNKKPSKTTLNEYAKIQVEIQSEDTPVDTKDIEIVPAITLKYLKTEGQYRIYSFKPYLPFFEEDVNKVFEGKLYFDVEQEQVKIIEIKASESFSPAFSIKVKEFSMSIDIDKAEQTLHVTKITSEKSGSVFLFGKFQEKSVKLFSDFVRHNE